VEVVRGGEVLEELGSGDFFGEGRSSPGSDATPRSRRARTRACSSRSERSSACSRASFLPTPSSSEGRCGSVQAAAQPPI